LQSKASAHGHFYICGNFVPGYKEYLEKKLNHPSISIMGYVNDLTTLLHQCDAMILPSIEEGSSLITTEAMACGNVLIVSDATGAQCEHMVEGLVHRPGDLNTITEHLNLLSDNNVLLKKMKKNCLEKSKKLTWEHAVNKLVSIYENS
jgi:glycosyltransferase involved in cell wall biosynthesis